MPASSAAAATNRPEVLTERLSLPEGKERETLLKTLREVKNQIIGNKTKKLLYLQLGAVPKIVSVLASASDDSRQRDADLIVQAAASIGSFACGVEDGVRAVIDGGAVPLLTRILSYPDEKVVDAGARSLRMIFQSTLAPKYDVLQEKNMKFLLLLLNSENENVSELAASIISHSCESNAEQKALSDAGVLERLVNLLKCSLSLRDAYLHSIAAVVRNNSEIATKFACINSGKALSYLNELLQDRFPRTRLLASVCLIAIGYASPSYVPELQTRTKLILILVDLLEEAGQAGDDAPFALSELIAGNEELHQQAVSINVIEKLCNFLQKGSIPARRLQGILLALAELCSKLEKCRCQLISLQVLDKIAGALEHDSADVRIAACMCIRSISRSVKNLSAGRFSNDAIVVPLVQLLHDPSTSVQVSALAAVGNVAIDFTSRKSVFVQCGGITQLVQLSKSMDSTIRLKSVRALRNLLFLGDRISKENILMELTLSTMASLICDSVLLVQEQAVALISNLIDGSADCTEHIFAEDNIIMNAVVRQLRNASSPEICTQGMLLLSNIAAGDESHKDAVMSCLVPIEADGCSTPFIIKFMQSKHNLLRTAAVWCIVNLTYPDGAGSPLRVARLQDAGVVSQIKKMVNDPFLDCKFRVRTVLGQCMAENVST